MATRVEVAARPERRRRARAGGRLARLRRRRRRARTEGYVVFVDGALARRSGPRPRPPPQARLRAGAGHRADRAGTRSRSRPLADHPGAPWQELRYERQLEIKQAQVDDALRRIGHLDGFALDTIVPAEQLWRYRNKLEYSFGRTPGGELALGFHAPGSWERIVALDDCLLASEAANAARQTSARLVQRAGACALRPSRAHAASYVT